MEGRKHIVMTALGTAQEQWHLAVEQRAPQPLVQLRAKSQLRPPKVQKRLLRISRIKTIWRLLRLRWQGTSAAAQLTVPELLWAERLVGGPLLQTKAMALGAALHASPPHLEACLQQRIVHRLVERIAALLHFLRRCKNCIRALSPADRVDHMPYHPRLYEPSARTC